MRVLWLPTVLRAAGLRVHEVPGWKARGSDTFGPVRGITCHHTAGSRTSSVEGEIRVLMQGSQSAPPPIAQLLLARTGDVHVVASGTCFHNRVGWDGPNEGYGNDALLGIEAQHSGGTEPWTDVQYQAYVTTVAALVRHKAPGWDVTVGRVAGHKEHQPGSKSDPTFSMATFRTTVARKLATWEADALRDLVFQPVESRLPILKYGDSDREGFKNSDTYYVSRAQRLLQVTPDDGIYGDDTAAAVKALGIAGHDGRTIDLPVWERIAALWGATANAGKD